MKKYFVLLNTGETGVFEVMRDPENKMYLLDTYREAYKSAKQTGHGSVYGFTIYSFKGTK